MVRNEDESLRLCFQVIIIRTVSLPLFSPVKCGYSENMVAHRKHPHFAILVTATLHPVHQNRPKQEGCLVGEAETLGKGSPGMVVVFFYFPLGEVQHLQILQQNYQQIITSI